MSCTTPDIFKLYHFGHIYVHHRSLRTFWVHLLHCLAKVWPQSPELNLSFVFLHIWNFWIASILGTSLNTIFDWCSQLSNNLDNNMASVTWGEPTFCLALSSADVFSYRKFPYWGHVHHFRLMFSTVERSRYKMFPQSPKVNLHFDLLDIWNVETASSLGIYI